MLESKKFSLFLVVFCVLLVTVFLSGCHILIPATTRDPSTSTQPAAVRPTSPSSATYTCEYVQGSTILGRQTLPDGTLIPEPNVTLNDDVEARYTLIGWDADGDGVPEVFPYKLSADTRFVMLYTVEPIVYHYDIYVKGELVASCDAHYGDVITYPNVESSIIGEEVNIFLGWEYDGLFDGCRYNNVTKSVRIDAHFADSQICRYYYNANLYAQYIEAGESLTFLSPWNVTPPSGKEIVWYTDSSYTIPYIGTAMPVGNLTLYGRAERPNGEDSKLSSREELLHQFNIMILNRVPEKEFFLSFSVPSVNNLLQYLIDNGLTLNNYKVNASFFDTVLTISLSFEEMATKKSPTVAYTRIASLNIGAYPNVRSASFNDFAVEKRPESFFVNNSDALFYAIEHGYRPVIDASNTALTSLYNSMKNVLRRIVRNDMTEWEKAKAIYEYLASEITYDDYVLSLTKKGVKNLSAYNAFYMEGVFNDHLAVCDGISKAYAALCGIEGIPCVRVTGVTKEGVSHAWNKVQLGGNWYVVDATSGGTIVGKEMVFTYAYFLLTDQQYSAVAAADGRYFPEINATNSVDIYSQIAYQFNGKTYSLRFTNVEDAAAVIRHVYESAPAGASSFDFKLAIPGESVSSALDKILSAVDLSIKIQYAQPLDSLTLIFSK